MVNPNIVNYIRNRLKKGEDIINIKKILLNQKLPLRDINEAIVFVNKELENEKARKELQKAVEAEKKAKHTGYRKKIFIGIIFVVVAVAVFLFILSNSSRVAVSFFNVSEYNLSQGVSLELSEGFEISFNIENENYKINVKLLEEDLICLTGFFEDFCMSENENSMTILLQDDFNSSLLINLDSMQYPLADLSLKLSSLYVCSESWDCTDWSVCINGLQKRLCVDANSCGTFQNKPSLEKECFIDSTQIFSYDFNGSSSSFLDCSNFSLPSCGIAYPDLVSNYVQEIAGEIVSIPIYDEDCSLVCFGENLLNSCEPAKVNLIGEDGSETLLEVLGTEGLDCLVNMTIIKEVPEYFLFEGTNLFCPIPLEDMQAVSCFMDNCIEEGKPGQTAVNIMGAMFYSATEDQDTICEGSFIEAYLKLIN